MEMGRWSMSPVEAGSWAVSCPEGKGDQTGRERVQALMRGTSDVGILALASHQWIECMKRGSRETHDGEGENGLF